MRASMLGDALRSLATSACVALCACPHVPEDDFRSQGGISPDPTAVVGGSVLYRGPRPACSYREGVAQVRGRIVLTLFFADNPPPPEGRASSAENVLFINGDRLFATTDCAPEGQDVDERDTIERSVPFRWPQLALQPSARDYQIRGFFDADENMNPFFDVTRLATFGDVIGGALVDPAEPALGLARITLPAAADARNGFVTDGALVTLGAVVRTERPMFKLSADRALRSAAILDVPPDMQKIAADPAGCLAQPSTCVNRSGLLENTRKLTCSGNSPDCGLSLLALDPDDVSDTFAATGLDPTFDPARYGFFSAPVDVLTVRPGEPDVPLADGIADPHPLLGANANVPWLAPITLLRRLTFDAGSAAREKAAGIPDVLLIGSVLLDAAGDNAARSVYMGQMPLAIPPIAAVDLDPSRSDCRVPYVPPGNLKTVYEASFVHCAELPTGVYGASVLAGLAGGSRVDDSTSDVGFSYSGAQPSGQAWSVPNELADSAQVGDAPVLMDQGPGGLFVVYDDAPDDTGDCTRAVDPAQRLLDPRAAPVAVHFRGICDDDAPPLYELGAGIDALGCLPDACCAAIRHLCGVPLCPACDDVSCPDLAAQGLPVRLSPAFVTRNAEGVSVPDCVPFELPTQCCAAP